MQGLYKGLGLQSNLEEKILTTNMTYKISIDKSTL